MKKHRKIFYVSGMISVLFTAPLFWYFSKPTLEKMNLRVLDIGLPAKAKNGEKLLESAKIPMDGWNYKEIRLPADFTEATEKKMLNLVNKLQSEKIEKSGLKIKFSKENSYGDIVKLLNIMLKTNQEYYGFDLERSNSLYILYYKPPKKEENLFYGDQDFTYSKQKDYDYHHSSFWQRLIKFSPRESFYLIFGFLILVYCAILKPKLTLNL